ncbi:MAG: VOC family protein [Verrucomicrobiales bacterium]|nr:VOC family protein [Verrucomicrobiales bacterium]
MNLAIGSTCLLLAMFAGFGCASSQHHSHGSEETRIPYELNFTGVTATEWSEEYRFYTQSLGFRPHSQRGQWALFGAGWDDYVTGRSRGLVCELFERGVPSSPHTTNHVANVCLGLRVHNLENAMAAASARGVTFPTPPKMIGTQRRVEFTTSAGTQWLLYSSPATSARDSLQEPEILLVELGVENLPGQIAFYHEVLGMKLVKRTATHAALEQFPNGPQLVLAIEALERGHPPRPRSPEPILSQPVFLGFMTPDAHAAAMQLSALKIPILTEVQHHEWGGTDVIVSDADGNAVQIYELDDPRKFGAERPSQDH